MFQIKRLLFSVSFFISSLIVVTRLEAVAYSGLCQRYFASGEDLIGCYSKQGRDALAFMAQKIEQLTTGKPMLVLNDAIEMLQSHITDARLGRRPDVTAYDLQREETLLQILSDLQVVDFVKYATEAQKFLERVSSISP
jgi:hypothetical protein